MSATLNITQDPNSAVSNIIAHDHSDGALGQQIPTSGIKDGAVTNAKLASGAVDGTKLAAQAVVTNNLADGAVTMAKLGADVQAAQSGGILGVTNYIQPGTMNITPSFTSLSATVNTGSVSLGAKNHSLTSPYALSNLPARMAQLAYAQYNPNSPTPSIGTVNAQYPALAADHVGRWIFNAKTNGTTVLDTSPSANSLTITGGVTLVDGWADYGMRTDGTTGYFISAGTTGEPVGAAVRSMNCLVTFHQLPAASMFLCGYGTTAATGTFGVFYDTDGFIKLNNYTTNFATIFYPIVGNTYLLTVTYDGTNMRLYVNGTLVYNGVVTCATVAAAFKVGLAPYSSANIAYMTFHYVDLRNTCMTAAQIGLQANLCMFPNTYVTANASYPTITKANSHEYRFDDVSGTTVTDTGNAVPAWAGTAGAPNTIVPSTMGASMGNARIGTSGAGSQVLINQSIQLGNSFTGVAVFRITDVAAYRSIFGNNMTTAQGFSFLAESVAGQPRMALWDFGTSGNSVYSNAKLDVNNLNFVAFTYDNGVVTFYINSPFPDVVTHYTPTAGAATLQTSFTLLASGSINANQFQGTMEYIYINPSAVLAQEEIQAMYSSLMGQNVTHTFAGDVLPSPSNSVPLGLIRTSSTACTVVDDVSYKYGRNESAVKGEGNKRVFLGWKWHTTGSYYYWDNPFGTDQVKVDIVEKKSLSDYGLVIDLDTIYSTTYYGTMMAGVTQHWIRSYGGNGYLANINTYDQGAWTGAWVGLWVQLL